MSDPDFSSDFFIRLNNGTEAAAERVDRRFRQQLCSLVARELGKRLAVRQGPEDVVQSVFRSFFRGIDAHRFRIDTSGELWALLETIARHKILQHVEHNNAQKRTPDREVRAEGDLFLSREPLPEEAAHVADVIEQVLKGLEPPDPQVFRLRLEGYTREEIAKRVNCTLAAVRCKLDRIKARVKRLRDKGAIG
jgi:RNA polymerase sigma-70 factor (ECF subfamily)